MKFLETDLPGVLIVEPDVHRDPRGFFLEAWHREKYARAGVTDPMVQFNHSRSGRDTVRGLHAQIEHPQGKLVRVVEGKIFDVAVDIRKGSPTFARWTAADLSAANFRQMYVPPGFAHGFAVLTDHAQVEYGCTDVYRPTDEIVIAWDDPEIDIRWPVGSPVLSPRDASAPRLAEVAGRLPTFRPSD